MPRREAPPQVLPNLVTLGNSNHVDSPKKRDYALTPIAAGQVLISDLWRPSPMSLIQRLCVPCIVLGSALFLLALEAAAADSGTSSPLLTWRDLALAAVGLIAALVGAFAKGQQGRVDKLESKLDTLSAKIAQDHPNEPRIKEYIASANATVDLRLCSVENSLRAVHRRLDYLRVPAVHNGFTHHEDDGN